MATLTKSISIIVIVLAYALTLMTQLPHIYDVYYAMEKTEHNLFGLSTALGAAVSFELSVAILTWRYITNTKSLRSRWTRPGIMGFLILSGVANISYYFDIDQLDTKIMPVLLAIALPLALWLYAEEFGAEAGKSVKKMVRESERESKVAVSLPDWQESNRCWCGWVPSSQTNLQQQMAGHKGMHTKQVLQEKYSNAVDALNGLRKLYPHAFDNGSDPITLEDVATIRLRKDGI